MTLNINKTFPTIFLIFVGLFIVDAQTVKPLRPRNYDVQHYIIRIKFDRANKTIFGDTLIKLKLTSASQQTIELDAAGLYFESVSLAAENKNLIYKTDKEKVFITLDKKYSIGETLNIQLKYRTKPKKGVYFVDALENDGVVTRAAQIWTQGEAEESRHWFPGNDRPDDKATSEEYVTVEKDETAIGNGELIEIIDDADSSKTFHFAMSLPHSTYLTSFVVGKYARIADQYKNIPLGFYVYPDKIALAPTAFGKTKNMMRVYEELTGVNFPFNKYDQTMVAEFEFGGMENITATTMSDIEINFAQFDFGKPLVEDLVSHELAHSWFGNLVTCRDWSELWLNEGFATYMEAAYREKIYGHADYLRKIKENAQQFMIADARSKSRPPLYNPQADPKTVFDEPEFVYDKGGAVLYMLRETIGAEHFWKAVNVYLVRHRFGNVETADLKNAMEETSDLNLNSFFNQWIYAAGFPHLIIKKSFNPKTKILSLNVSQVQKTDGSTPAAFIFPLEIEITTAKSMRSEIISIKKRSENFEIKLDAAPRKVIYDPNEKIPLKLIK